MLEFSWYMPILWCGSDIDQILIRSCGSQGVLHFWRVALTKGIEPLPAPPTMQLLFTSTKHGASFSTFMGALSSVGEEGAAPTLLLIKDKGGHLMGGIAYEPWKKTGTFYGDYASLIFGLEPSTVVYQASGINANIQWCVGGGSQLGGCCCPTFLMWKVNL